MATIDFFKGALWHKAEASSAKRPLTEIEYDDGFKIIFHGSMTYRDFVVTQLSQQIASLVHSRDSISVLEIGPGPESVLGGLPDCLKRNINRYDAYEPNSLFATRLETWLYSPVETETPLPCLRCKPEIYRIPFAPENRDGSTSLGDGRRHKYDMILFCHSMYGMEPKEQFIRRALELAVEDSEDGTVVVFRPDNESDVLWALKGAGTNVGVVVRLTFLPAKSSNYRTRSWVSSVEADQETLLKFDQYTLVAKGLARPCSADAYLYRTAGKLHFGMSLIEEQEGPSWVYEQTPIPAIFGPEDNFEVVLWIGLSTRRCKTSPKPLCYLHLLHGGGAIRDVAPNAPAFGCRDWEFACVVTGIWPRYEDDSRNAYFAIRWVYDVVEMLLPLSCGVYGADLGPDSRDAPLAARAFGYNRRRLGHLKSTLDPYNVLPYACPLPRTRQTQKLIVLVTGETCVGKDYCANVWARELARSHKQDLIVHVVSISDATKHEYSVAVGADLKRLLSDRVYKEQHRPALTRFFQDQVRR